MARTEVSTSRDRGKVATWTIVGLVLLITLIAVAERRYLAADEPDHSTVDLNKQMTLTGDVGRPYSDLAPPPAQGASTHTQTTAPADESLQTASDKGNSIDAIDNTVIGRPFSLSASVDRTCKLPSASDTELCTAVRNLLSRMGNEPRDVAWATAIEAKLREHVAENPGFEIRSLECRKTLCAAEVTSTIGPASRQLKYGSVLDKELASELGTVGYESNENGEHVTVTLIVYSRR